MELCLMLYNILDGEVWENGYVYKFESLAVHLILSTWLIGYISIKN